MRQKKQCIFELVFLFKLLTVGCVIKELRIHASIVQQWGHVHGIWMWWWWLLLSIWRLHELLLLCLLLLLLLVLVEIEEFWHVSSVDVAKAIRGWRVLLLMTWMMLAIELLLLLLRWMLWMVRRKLLMLLQHLSVSLVGRIKQIVGKFVWKELIIIFWIRIEIKPIKLYFQLLFTLTLQSIKVWHSQPVDYVSFLLVLLLMLHS